MVRYIIIHLIFICFSIQAQDRVLDSLQNILSSSIHDTDKVKIILEIVSKTVVNNPSEAIKYADSALSVSQRTGYKKGIGESYIRLASAQITKGAYDLGIKNLISAADIYAKLKPKRKLAQTYNILANAYLGLKDYKKANFYYIKSYEVASSQPIDLSDKAVAAVGIGNSWVKLNELEKGLPYFFEAEKLFIELDNKNNLHYVKLFIGESYLRNKRYNEGKKYVELAYQYFKDKDDDYALGMIHQKYGEFYYHAHLLGEAAINFEKSLAISLNRAAWDDIQENALMLSKVYEAQKNTPKALENYKLYSDYKDSVINKERNEAIANAESKYESNQKEQQLKIKNIELEKSELKINQRNNLIYIFSIALMLFIILLVFSVRQTLLKNKINLNLLEANNRTESQKSIIELKNKEIMDSIMYAKRIQYALLVNQEVINEFVHGNFILFKPKDIVSGDFYWATENNNKFYLAVCDSTGHGVPGAFMSLLNIGFLSEAIKEKGISAPHEVLNYVRTRLISSIGVDGQKDGMDCILMCVDKATRSISYSAANNAPVLISKGRVVELEKDRMSVGKGESEDSFTLYQLDYSKGDMLYLYTDGYADQFGGPKGKKFKYKALNELLLKLSDLPMEEQRVKIEAEFDNWKGDLEQVDDVCLIGIKLG